MFDFERRKSVGKAAKLKYSLACLLLIILVIVSAIAFIESSDNSNDTNTNGKVNDNLVYLKPIPEVCIDVVLNKYSSNTDQQQQQKQSVHSNFFINNIDIWNGTGEIMYDRCVEIRDNLIYKISKCPSAANSQLKDKNETNIRKLLMPLFIDIDFNIRVDDQFDSKNSISFNLEDKLNTNDNDFIKHLYENAVTSIQILSSDIDDLVLYRSMIYDFFIPLVVDNGSHDNTGTVEENSNYQKFDSIPTMHVGCDEQGLEEFSLIAQKMLELMSLEKEWCLKMKPTNATYYDSIKYGNIDKNYDIEQMRSFFHKNIVSSARCATLSNWKSLKEVEQRFGRRIDLVTDPPEELVSGDDSDGRNYVISLDYIFKQEWKQIANKLKSVLISNIFGEQHGVDTNKKRKEQNQNAEMKNVFLSSGKENNLLYQASKLIYYGVDRHQTVSMLTEKSLNVLGLDEKFKNYKKTFVESTTDDNSYADFSVWTNDPFQGFEKPAEIYSKGVKIYESGEPLSFLETLVDKNNIFYSKQIDAPKEFTTEPSADAESFATTHYTRVFGDRRKTEVDGKDKWARNDFFRIYDVHSFVYIGANEQQKRKMNPVKNVRNDNYVIKNVDILDVDQKDDTNWIYEDCIIHVERGNVKCIHCAFNDAGMYHDQCTIDYTQSNLYVYDFEIYFSLNKNIGITTDTKKKSSFRAIALGAPIGVTTHRIKSKAIDLDIESLIKNIEQSASVEIRDDTRFMTRQLNASWEEAVQSIVVNAQVSNFIGGQSVVFESNAKNIEEGLIAEAFTIHMTMQDSEDFSIGQQFAILRRLFQEASVRKHEKDQKAGNIGTMPDNNVDQFFDDMTVFEKIIAKKYSLSVTVDKADAISNLIKMKLQYGFDLIIYGALEASRVADEIGLSDTRVVFTDIGFTSDSRAKKQFADNIREFSRRKINFGFSVDDEELIHELRWRSSKLLRHGQSYKQTLESITKNIRNAYKMPDNYGGIGIGKRANIAVFDNDPLSFYGKPLFSANGNLITVF